MRAVGATREARTQEAAASIDRYTGYISGADIGNFHIERAHGFKQQLASQRHARTSNPLSVGTIDGTLTDFSAFFLWLADQSDYRSKIRPSDAA